MCMCCSGDAGESAGRRGSRIGDLAIPAQVTRGPRSRTCCRNNRTHLCTNSSHVSSSTAGYRRDRRGTSAFCRHRQTNLGSSRPIPTSICHLLSVRAAGYSHLYRLATTSTTTTASFASISSSSSSNSNKNSVAILYTTRPAIPISSSLRVPSERLRRDQQYLTPPCLLSTWQEPCTPSESPFHFVSYVRFLYTPRGKDRVEFQQADRFTEPLLFLTRATLFLLYFLRRIVPSRTIFPGQNEIKLETNFLSRVFVLPFETKDEIFSKLSYGSSRRVYRFLANFSTTRLDPKKMTITQMQLE